jgi:hypothetical protein
MNTRITAFERSVYLMLSRRWRDISRETWFCGLAAEAAKRRRGCVCKYLFRKRWPRLSCAFDCFVQVAIEWNPHLFK